MREITVFSKKKRGGKKSYFQFDTRTIKTKNLVRNLCVLRDTNLGFSGHTKANQHFIISNKLQESEVSWPDNVQLQKLITVFISSRVED